MARPQHYRRLFVAAFVPSEIRAAWLAMPEVRALLPDPEAVPAELLLSVHFIGDVARRDLDGVIESGERSVAGFTGFRLEPTAVGTVPRDDLARQLALFMSAPPALIEIKKRLVERLARSRKKPREPYSPRITLVRYPAPVADLAVWETVSAAGFEVRELFLLRTIIRSDGVVHEGVAQYSLDG